MKKIIAAVSTVFIFAAFGIGQQSNLQELRRENRLPGWANYICYVDTKGMDQSWFMLVAYAPAKDFAPAARFGYKRGITFQEYNVFRDGISASNLPASPEEVESALQDYAKKGTAPIGVVVLLQTKIQSFENAVAFAKVVAQRESGEELRKDKLTTALLDAPSGTNYHNFLAENPQFPESVLHTQKYLNAGVRIPDVKPYREGNIIFEKDFGNGLFLTDPENKFKGDPIRVEIQMQETESGLRFSRRFQRTDSLGTPFMGRCDPIAQ